MAITDEDGYQLIRFTITTSGQQVVINEESKKEYDTITGINVLMTDDNAMFSTLPIDIDGREVFPDFWEVIRIKLRPQVPMDYDYHGLNRPANGSRIKGTYTDVPAGQGYPYAVTISLKLRNKANTDTGRL